MTVNLTLAIFKILHIIQFHFGRNTSSVIQKKIILCLKIIFSEFIIIFKNGDNIF